MVGIGQVTPGMVLKHDKVGNASTWLAAPVAAVACSPGQFKNGMVGGTGTGQLMPGIVRGKHDDSGIVGNAAAASVVAVWMVLVADKQLVTGMVGIGQVTPGIV
jgi:hypothetical protein